MPSVFISHSHKDKEFVRKLASDLSARGVRPWLDEAEIRPGDSFVEKINEGINATDFMLVVLSKDSVESGWVQEEVRRALEHDPDKANRFLIPVLIDDITVPKALSSIKYADLSDPATYRDNLAQLVSALGESRPAPKAAIRELLGG